MSSESPKAYVDANVICRLLTGDPPELADKAAELFERVDKGQLELFVDAMVVAETVWVLSSFYGFSCDQIVPLLSTLLVHDGILCDDKTELLQALALYEKKGVDFVDALLAVRMGKRNAKCIYSFDKHFDRLESIQRLAPE